MSNKVFFDSGEGYRKQKAWAVPILLLVFFFMGQVLSMVPPIEMGFFTEEEIETYPTILYMLIAGFGAPLLILALWLRFGEKRVLASIGMLRSSAAKLFACGLGLGAGMASVSVLGIGLAGGYEIETTQDFAAVSYLPILLLALGFIVQSGVEEILFRGWMLSRLTERYSLWVGVLGNSTLFMLMHLDIAGEEAFHLGDFAIFVTMTMAFSIFLSFLVIRQQSIWGACAWHAAWNWSFITWFGLPTTGIVLDITPLWVDLIMTDNAPNWLTGGSAGPENSVITTIVLVLSCVLLARIIFHNRA
ncbi:CPBP family intramembrane glutamic endopeptidase [Lacimicrobium alkaliphilum]|uniref:CAAX prenyl protease 2/Lysostaphin resistance protein A-like domain-containing protein n=1 Tax=Lacimicrobium alkaliphilum TaxID=1526571 RepID=A0A0U3A7E0_9ALTE|nr:type II CAAX endopeptidase family protein [Lacimicrobium alkaliphilum]ALS96910.1 hypothetical protein AT746_00535 [Lacimicrobium alkaliphilum]